MKANGLNQNKQASKTSGGIAKKARHNLESSTGKSVISNQNYLPPEQTKPHNKP